MNVKAPSFFGGLFVSLVLYPLGIILSWCIYFFRCIFRRSEDNWSLAGDFDSKVKLVVVTGCDSGFGRLLAEHVASIKPDYRILALTLNEDSANEINKIGNDTSNRSKLVNNLMAMQCDVTSDAHVDLVKSKVRSILDEDDNVILYSIVNNAGWTDACEFLWLNDTSSIFRQMDINYFGAVRMVKALLPLMLRSSLDYTGRIINLSSVVGADSSKYCTGYAASKHALEGFADSLRAELAPFHIRVVNVRPGRTETPLLGAFFEKMIANFENSPKEIKALYGGENFLKNLRGTFDPKTAMKDPLIQSPDEVVWTLTNLLTKPKTNPYPHYFVGFDARFVYRAWSSVPAHVSEAAKCALDPVATIVTRPSKGK